MIGAGHRLDDVREYTLAQVKGFIGAIERAGRRESLAFAIAGRAAQADRAGFQAYMRALEKADENVDSRTANKD